ncbi:hypothetical protein MPTK1_4g03670 [Marchantia polymorpha subsp. ruderalis]|uniref:Bulb-type lectin domain-containing protein n=2 Tax=Marchantia polymorpha TaxID=3197 RepID=A0AAF6B5X8_MARPO|nr:hypothetical protein MARPO_0044s0107 [Marchantia polymorpha]BBN07412.1 hypothetical protein Mp_4g03670 [Marchantia polymorpha subsp. ruderalis]|eukprot:PTQ39689.1 hypothetical protein MARPO_0044s0107 [Marchantia polymorpha]
MMLSDGHSAAAMASQGSRLRSVVGIIISCILVWLPTTFAGGFASAGVGGRRPFEYFVFQDWESLQRQEGCSPMGVSQIVNSPNEKYGLAQAMLCPDRELSPWNISFVFGVSINPLSLDNGLWTWTVPVDFNQPTNSCSLRFTEDGDLQFTVPINPTDYGSPGPWTQSRVLWSSNTSGLGAVEVQVQDSGNLVLVHEDGKSVVWKALDIPVLPLLPLSEAATSTTGYLRIAMSAVLVAHVLPFLISCL